KQIGDERAERHLREDALTMRRCPLHVLPVDISDILTPQSPILPILSTKNVRPVSGEIAPHADEIIAGTGEDERDPTESTERFGIEEEPVSQGCWNRAAGYDSAGRVDELVKLLVIARNKCDGERSLR